LQHKAKHFLLTLRILDFSANFMALEHPPVNPHKETNHNLLI